MVGFLTEVKGEGVPVLPDLKVTGHSEASLSPFIPPGANQIVTRVYLQHPSVSHYIKTWTVVLNLEHLSIMVHEEQKASFDHSFSTFSAKFFPPGISISSLIHQTSNHC